MPNRRARLLVEPLSDWPHPQVTTVTSPFTTTAAGATRPVPWTTTRDELLREADHLGASQVVLELDCERRHLRRDGGGILAEARLNTGRVRISMDTRYGPMRWALARYDAAGLSWQANVRGIVLTLASLRAVDRYGAVTDGQQYRGFLAIEAGAAAPPATGWDLTDPDGARAWLERLTGQTSLGDQVRHARRQADADPEVAARLAVVERTLTGAGSAADVGGSA